MEHWGYHPRDITRVRQELRDRGVILRVRKHNRAAHQPEEYRINPSLVTEIYPATSFFFPNFKQASRGIHRPHQVIEVDDPEIKAYLKDSPFSWNGQKALEILFDPQVVPQEKRQTMWGLIWSVPTSDQVRANWKQSETTGRLSARRPAIQNIPKEFRRPGVISPTGDRLWEVDFKAQHFQISRILSGRPPLPDPWERLEEDTGIERDSGKTIVNAFLGGQHKGAFLWNQGRKGLYSENDPQMYDLVRSWLERHGILQEIEVIELMRWSSEILRQSLSLMKRAGVRMIMPLHDGVIVNATQRGVESTFEAFYDSSFHVLGIPLPIQLEPL